MIGEEEILVRSVKKSELHNVNQWYKMWKIKPYKNDVENSNIYICIIKTLMKDR